MNWFGAPVSRGSIAHPYRLAPPIRPVCMLILDSSLPTPIFQSTSFTWIYGRTCNCRCRLSSTPSRPRKMQSSTLMHEVRISHARTMLPPGPCLIQGGATGLILRNPYLGDTTLRSRFADIEKLLRSHPVSNGVFDRLATSNWSA